MAAIATKSRRVTGLRVGIAAGVAVILISLWKLLLAPITPEQIRDGAIRALESGDAAALCRLADEEELKRLHIDASKTEAILKATLWQNGLPSRANVILFAAKPLDKRSWLVEWKGMTKANGMFGITAVDDRNVGWKLVLSDLLNSGCYWVRPGRDGGKLYKTLALEHGITGIRAQDATYSEFVRPADPLTAQ